MGQRGIADGLVGIRVVVKVPMGGGINAGLAVGWGDVEGLALSYVAEDLTKAGLDAEAVASAPLHLLTSARRRPGSRSCLYQRPHPEPSCERPAAPPAHNAAGVSAG